PPRRRGRDGQVDPLRRTGRGRRHGRRRRAPGPGAHQRPRHGGRAARGRRLRDRSRRRASARRRHADAVTSTLFRGGPVITWEDRLATALVVEDGVVVSHDEGPADEVVELDGRCLVPGFVDSHTHLVFGGDRTAEFEARMTGTPYAAGGIRKTVAAT